LHAVLPGLLNVVLAHTSTVGAAALLIGKGRLLATRRGLLLLRLRGARSEDGGSGDDQGYLHPFLPNFDLGQVLVRRAATLQRHKSALNPHPHRRGDRVGRIYLKGY
jgi:hypothetical protein